LTDCFVMNDLPSERSSTSLFRNPPYWT
jgi:hypothetical protein